MRNLPTPKTRQVPVTFNAVATLAPTQPPAPSAAEVLMQPVATSHPPQSFPPSDANVFISSLEENDELSPDFLHRMGGPRYGNKRWTLGSSTTLVEGAQGESPWVTAGWIFVPTGIAALLLFALLHG